MTTSGRVRENRSAGWLAFPKNHPLFRILLGLRNDGMSWTQLEAYAKKRGYPLSGGQMQYGWEKAGMSFLVFASPWVRREAEDLIEGKFPDLRVAAASLAAEVHLIDDVEALQQGAIRDYNDSAPEEGEHLSTDDMVARQAMLNTAIGLTGRLYNMQSQLLKDIAEYRKLWVITVPYDVVKEISEGAAGEEVQAATKLLSVSNMDSFWRESKRLQAIMRREYEVIIDMLRKGENVPELRPLSPTEMEIDAELDREEEEEARRKAGE